MSENYQALAQQYQQDGFTIHPTPIIPAEMIENAVANIPDIIAEKYDMGFPPSRRWNVGDRKKVQKMDMVHRCNRAFFDLVTHPPLGEAVAKICGAKRIQIWDTQLFIKPPQGGDNGNIGWHTDEVNWYWWSGDVFTIWLPLCDVSEREGTLAYIPASHQNDLEFSILDGYDQAMEKAEQDLKQKLPKDSFNPVYVEIPKGAFAVHHKKLIHGSRENASDNARICVAITVRTEHGIPVFDKDDMGHLEHLENPVFSPVIHYEL